MEQAYAYGKAKFHKDSNRAELIRKATTARDAQLVGNEISTSKSWQKVKQLFMESLLYEKLNQCDEFKSSLNRACPILVEATGHPFWGSGLNWKETINCEVGKWPGNNHLGKLLQKMQQKIKDVKMSEKQVTLIGDSNTKPLDDRLQADKHIAYTLVEAQKLCHSVETGDTLLFHVGVNDIEESVKNTIFINTEDKKRITEDISGKMCDLINSALKKKTCKVVWSKCLPHAHDFTNDIIESVNIRVHSKFIGNPSVTMCENSSVTYKVNFPTKSFIEMRNI